MNEEYKGYCKGRKDTENKFKEAIKNFKKELNIVLDVDDEYMPIDLVVQRWIYSILPLFKKHFGADLCSEEKE